MKKMPITITKLDLHSSIPNCHLAAIICNNNHADDDFDDNVDFHDDDDDDNNNNNNSNNSNKCIQLQSSYTKLFIS